MRSFRAPRQSENEEGHHAPGGVGRKVQDEITLPASNAAARRTALGPVCCDAPFREDVVAGLKRTRDRLGDSTGITDS